MKKIAVFAMALIMCLSLLVSCSSNKLVSRQGGLYDEENQIYYSYAPLCVEALSYSPEAHISDAYEYNYHAVYDMKKNKCDPSQLLYEPSGHTLIYNSSTEFPTILKFEANQAVFYLPGNSEQSLSSVDDAAETVKLTNIFKNPSMQYNANASTETYKLRFFSEKFPYFAFVYTYIEYPSDQKVDVKVESLESYTFIEGVPHEEIQNSDGSYTVTYNYGKYFIYDRDSRLCYMAQYIHDAYNTVES